MMSKKEDFIKKELFDDPEVFKQFFSSNQEMLESFFNLASGEFIQKVEMKEHPKGGAPALGVWFYPREDWKSVIGNK